MGIKEEKKVEMVRVADDKLTAYLALDKKEDGGYTLDEVLKILSENKITYGICKEEIEKVIKEENYLLEFKAAEGIPPVQGKNGYFEFYFNVDPVKKPIILEDGSVDYNTLGKVELCKKDDLLAEYYPAIEGKNGIDVFGMPILAEKVKELKPLKGKGTRLSEDERQYFAARDGKVEYKDNKLNVEELYVVEGDVDAATGDINFNGDILICGNVTSNVKIEAEGNITVNGHVEMAILTAGKDIILRNGMQGNGKGYIFAKGDVSAKFFEQTVVVAKGNINANAIMNCEMDSNRQIIVAGKQGAIIGGIVKAVEKIEAAVVGNRAETKTELIAGLDIDFYKSIEEIDHLIEKLKGEIIELSKKIESVNGQLDKNEISILQETKSQLMRLKIGNDAKIKDLHARKVALLDQKQRSHDACILVLRKLYRNTRIIINGAKEDFNGECKNVTIREINNEIHIYANTVDKT